MVGLWAMGRLPVDDIRTLVGDARTNVEGLVQILDSVSLTPEVENLVATLGDATPEIAAARPASPTPTHTATATPTEVAASEVVSETAPLIGLGTASVTATLTLEVTLTPEEGEFYVVKAGDSLLGIGADLGVAWQDIAAANSLSGNSVLKIGQRLIVPAPTATPEPTPTPEPTGTAGATEAPTPTVTETATRGATPTATRKVNGAATALPTPTTAASPTATLTVVPKGNLASYKVRSGDSFSSIGAQFGIPWQDIVAANGLSASTRLQVGQELLIPLAGLPPTATPTRRPAMTATPAIAAQPPPVELLAPELGNPSSDTPFQGDATMIVLNWLPVTGITPAMRYQVTIRWTEGGSPQEWQSPPTTATEVRLPPWLFARADQPDRRYTWFVTVVQPTTDGQGGTVYQPMSAPSAARTLTWN
jgi:LysM repeat protein